MTDVGPGRTGWDFFVSYQQADHGWAQWIAWQLDAAGYSVLFQGWDFVPGSNWVNLMQDGVSRSARLIAVVSPAYIDSEFGAAEWQTIWAGDPTGSRRRVIPVRVVDCERPGLLAGIVSINLFGISEAKARKRLLEAVTRALAGSAKPLGAPSFRGTPVGGDSESESSAAQHAAPVPAQRPQFPGNNYRINLRGARGVQIGDGNTQNIRF